MRAVRGSNGLLSFVSKDEARVINLIKADQFTPITSLSERDHYIAEELFKKNLIRKVNQNNNMGYKAFSERL